MTRRTMITILMGLAIGCGRSNPPVATSGGVDEPTPAKLPPTKTTPSPIKEPLYLRGEFEEDWHLKVRGFRLFHHKVNMVQYVSLEGIKFRMCWPYTPIDQPERFYGTIDEKLRVNKPREKKIEHKCDDQVIATSTAVLDLEDEAGGKYMLCLDESWRRVALVREPEKADGPDLQYRSFVYNDKKQEIYLKWITLPDTAKEEPTQGKIQGVELQSRVPVVSMVSGRVITVTSKAGDMPKSEPHSYRDSKEDLIAKLDLSDRTHQFTYIKDRHGNGYIILVYKEGYNPVFIPQAWVQEHLMQAKK